MTGSLYTQLQKLNTLQYIVDGVESGPIEDTSSEIIFYAKSKRQDDGISVTFEDYFVHPYATFNFHKQFNNDNPPPPNIHMRGQILRETEKLYYFRLHDEMTGEVWEGFCPKKCCTIN